jgi:hypothetical protein
MIFSHDAEQPEPPELKEDLEATRSRPHLKIVK